MKRKMICTAAAAMFLLTCGCSEPTYDGFSVPEQEKSTLQPVGDLTTGNCYEGIEPTAEPTKAEFSSADGLCVIRQKTHYYDITLDLTQGDHFAAGKAYAEAILKAIPDYRVLMDGYLHENIRVAFPETKNDDVYDILIKRVDALTDALQKDYREELRGFADVMADAEKPFADDGMISEYEANLLHMVPDILRTTACSAISADGSRTASGKRLSARLLEWDLGKGNKMCSAHCVLHLENGDSSLISVTSVGLLDVITGINQNGVFAGDLDVGSYDTEYTAEGKSSYSFAMREGLETCSTAREFGAFITADAERYPYAHNVFITDAEDAFVAENCVSPNEGSAVLRDADTPLCKGVEWDAEGCICAVNSFVSADLPEFMTINENNIVRWEKYNKLFATDEKLTVSRFKDLLTSEQTDTSLVNIRSDGLVFLLIADYDTNRIQAAFTTTDGVTDTPEFSDLGSFR
ncbi:MAG: hypothetical protein IKQ39_03640 [Oscillospiraceae bacterium]|nr:hypothetical protein [Oscillospiraceae bacterium]